jgi:hypothetical protein
MELCDEWWNKYLDKINHPFSGRARLWCARPENRVSHSFCSSTDNPLKRTDLELQTINRFAIAFDYSVFHSNEV